MNLDNDAALEIVATMAGVARAGGVLAFAPNGSLIWLTTLSAHNLYFTSASASAPTPTATAGSRCSCRRRAARC